MKFWGELAGRVRREFPRARVVVNHLHRLWSPWHSAIPIDLYDADVIAGSEATRFDAAFCARKQRAYGKADTDVWGGLHDYFYRNATWPAACDKDNLYRHHALIENQFPLDVVYDGHLTPNRLPAYRVLVAPCAVALSDRRSKSYPTTWPAAACR